MRLLGLLLLVGLSFASDGPTQEEAVRGLIARVLPEHAPAFEVEYRSGPGDQDVWEVVSSPSRVRIRGSSGVAMASAFNWWLKYVCNSTYLWQEQQLSIPTPFPVAFKNATSTVTYRYYYNVCTFGYSSAFWHWDRWEREIDWMAMNGINFPLAFVGQEYVWERLFASLGMNQSAVRESWFSNQAFLPWNRMGNINNWAGPLSEDLIKAQVLLQKQVRGGGVPSSFSLDTNSWPPPPPNSFWTDSARLACAPFCLDLPVTCRLCL
jgi:alpha-N-acetylglucosaminidase